MTHTRQIKYRSPPLERRPGREPDPVDQWRLKHSYYLVFVSVCLVVAIFTIVYGLHIWLLQTPPEDLSSAMAAATGVIGTLVGTFFGHQLGAAGKEKTERRADDSREEQERVKCRVLARLPPGEPEKLREDLESGELRAPG